MLKILFFLKLFFSTQDYVKYVLKNNEIQLLENNFDIHYQLSYEGLHESNKLFEKYNIIKENLNDYSIKKLLSKEYFSKICNDINEDDNYIYKCFESQKTQDINNTFYQKYYSIMNSFKNVDLKNKNLFYLNEIYLLSEQFKMRKELEFICLDYAVNLFIKLTNSIFGDLIVLDNLEDYLNLTESQYACLGMVRFILKMLEKIKENNQIFNNNVFEISYVRNFKKYGNILFQTLGCDENNNARLGDARFIKYYNSFKMIEKSLEAMQKISKNVNPEEICKCMLELNRLRFISLIKFSILKNRNIVSSIDNEISYESGNYMFSNLYKKYNEIFGVEAKQTYSSDNIFDQRSLVNKDLNELGDILLIYFLNPGELHPDKIKNTSIFYDERPSKELGSLDNQKRDSLEIVFATIKNKKENELFTNLRDKIESINLDDKGPNPNVVKSAMKKNLNVKKGDEEKKKVKFDLSKNKTKKVIKYISRMKNFNSENSEEWKESDEENIDQGKKENIEHEEKENIEKIESKNIKEKEKEFIDNNENIEQAETENNEFINTKNIGKKETESGLSETKIIEKKEAKNIELIKTEKGEQKENEEPEIAKNDLDGILKKIVTLIFSLFYWALH